VPEYYINLFTTETWREIRENAKFTYTGHREGARNRAKVQPGDVFLCYVTRSSACVGALKVVSEFYEVYHEDPPTWVSDLYPVRFKTELLVRVPVDKGVHLEEIRARSADPRRWGWIYRNSLNEIPHEDAEWILDRLRDTEPKLGPDDPEPGPETALTPEADEVVSPGAEKSRHGPIQTMLVQLGLDLGLDVWVAANDRGVAINGGKLGDLSVDTLPSGLPDDVRRRISLIDVIWLRRNSYVAAFEVEATTGILSGLARMGDLLALVPNLDIPLFIVAPEERRGRVFEQITRPLFTLGLAKPLHRRCRFISFDTLDTELSELGARVKMLNPERFLDEIAEEAP
jgi:hypothetical protein